MVRITNMTKVKQQNEELKKEIQLYKNAIAGANVGIWEWDIKTGNQVVNERWAEIIGYTLEELAPVSINTFRSLIHPLDLADVDTKINFFNTKKKQYNIDFRMRHKNNHWVYVQSIGLVTSWTPEGDPLTMSGCHIDITERTLIE